MELSTVATRISLSRLLATYLQLRGTVNLTASFKYVATICLIQTASGKYIATVYFCLLIFEEEFYICHQLL